MRYRKANPDRTLEQQRRYSAAYLSKPENLRRKRDYALKKYGITRADFNGLLADQGGVCAICKGIPTGPRTFHVDHDHKTGAVRGLLCHHCNTMLGLAADDPQRLLTAVEYLKR